MNSCANFFRWRCSSPCLAFRHLTTILWAVLISACATLPKESESEESESKKSKSEESAPEVRDQKTRTDVTWKWLFDGSTLDHWTGLGASPSDRWVIDTEKKLLHKLPSNEDNYGGDLRTQERYENFELCFDFKLAQGANSGVKYNVSEAISAQHDHPSAAIGFEYQVLDDAYHPDAKAGNSGNRTVGGLYDLYPPAADKPEVVAGSWYTGCVLALTDTIRHSLNGQVVLEYQPGSADFGRRLAASKFADIENFSLRRAGYIVLQDHLDEVWYRNIKIRRLPRTGTNP